MNEAAMLTAPPPSPTDAAPARRLSAPAVFAVATCICLGTLLLLAHDAPRLRHWFVLPVLFCGILCTMEAIEWVRGEMDRFDPRGLIGVFGFHFFFLAPLLHMRWDYLMPEVTHPPDWREWLGYMAMLNGIGLVLYRICVGGRVMPGQAPRRPNLLLLENRFLAMLMIALPVTAVLQGLVYASFGGITGYIEAATDSSEGARNTMPGMGVIYMFTECFPILAMMGFAVLARGRPLLQSWPIIILAFAAFFVASMLFGGLRANRSNTVWNLFWAVGIVHFWLRPIPTRLIFAGLAFLVFFVYIYGLFKGFGLDAVEAIHDGDKREAMARETGRPIESTILDDFGRSDLHAYLLYRMAKPDSDYEYAWGRTYAVALMILVPRGLMERPPNMAKEGTEAQFGMGSFEPIVSESSRVYGLAGEAMLNFGPIGVPFAFLAWGLFVSWVRRRPAAWAPDDVRFLLYPIIVVVAFAAVFQDFENQLFFLFKFAAVPAVLLALATRVERVYGPTEARA